MGLFSPPPGLLFLNHWEDRGKPRSCMCDRPTDDTVIFMFLAYFTAPVVAELRAIVAPPTALQVQSTT